MGEIGVEVFVGAESSANSYVAGDIVSIVKEAFSTFVQAHNAKKYCSRHESSIHRAHGTRGVDNAGAD